jgi:hypothetical protein
MGEEVSMYTIRQASAITNIPYGRLWYGGIVGKYPRPELRVGNRLYYSTAQIHDILERRNNDRMASRVDAGTPRGNAAGDRPDD